MRRRALLIATTILAVGSASASEPGQPLDCSDAVFNVPGLSCRPLVPMGQILDPCNTDLWWKGSNLALDNLGRLLYIRLIGNEQRASIEVRRSDGASDELLASITTRTSPSGSDGIKPRSIDGSTGCPLLPYVPAGLQFDAANGRLFVWLVSVTSVPSCGGCATSSPWIASIEGFATTFEVLQSYTPQPASISFRVPYMPEGMAAADHFDTYWGNLAHPIDFTQAQPLQCGFPAAPPKVGDYLSVADTVPTPPPGQGVYYITATTYQDQTRYGRKASGGKLTGRDPTLLPLCGP